MAPYMYQQVARVACSSHQGAGNEDMAFGRRDAEVAEVEGSCEPLRERRSLMGVNQGTAEVRWSLLVFYADCPTRLICQCTL